MWAVFQKDPFLSFQMLWKGGMGQHFGSYPQGKDSITDGSQFMVPFGIQTIVTPFQAMTLGTTLTTGVTGFGSANYGSVTVLDDNAGIIELVQEGLTMKEWPDNARDIRSIQIHEKYDLMVVDGGRSSVVAKNIRVDRNWQAAFTIRNIPVS